MVGDVRGAEHAREPQSRRAHVCCGPRMRRRHWKSVQSNHVAGTAPDSALAPRGPRESTSAFTRVAESALTCGLLTACTGAARNHDGTRVVCTSWRPNGPRTLLVLPCAHALCKAACATVSARAAGCSRRVPCPAQLAGPMSFTMRADLQRTAGTVHRAPPHGVTQAHDSNAFFKHVCTIRSRRAFTRAARRCASACAARRRP